MCVWLFFKDLYLVNGDISDSSWSTLNSKPTSFSYQTEEALILGLTISLSLFSEDTQQKGIKYSTSFC